MIHSIYEFGNVKIEYESLDDFNNKIKKVSEQVAADLQALRIGITDIKTLEYFTKLDDVVRMQLRLISSCNNARLSQERAIIPTVDDRKLKHNRQSASSNYNTLALLIETQKQNKLHKIPELNIKLKAKLSNDVQERLRILHANLVGIQKFINENFENRKKENIRLVSPSPSNKNLLTKLTSHFWPSTSADNNATDPIKWAIKVTPASPKSRRTKK